MICDDIIIKKDNLQQDNLTQMTGALEEIDERAVITAPIFVHIK